MSTLLNKLFGTSRNDDDGRMKAVDYDEDHYVKLPTQFIKRIEFWDHARSGYIFTHLKDEEYYFDYCPMTPNRSSSGMYDGGPPIHKTISLQQFNTAQSKWNELASNTQDHVAEAFMGTLLMIEITNGNKRSFIIEGSSQSGSQLKDVLDSWKTKL